MPIEDETDLQECWPSEQSVVGNGGMSCCWQNRKIAPNCRASFASRRSPDGDSEFQKYPGDCWRA